MRTAPLLAAALLVAACAKPETPEQMQARIQAESDSVRQMAEGAATRFASFVTNKQADSIAALYAPDAKVMPPNMPMVVGRDSVRAMFTNWFAAGTPSLTLQVQSVAANGPIAIERGTSTWSFTPNPGSPMPAGSGTGKYLVHWHRVDGQWLIAEDIWNDDAPPPPPPPARRR